MNRAEVPEESSPAYLRNATRKSLFRSGAKILDVGPSQSGKLQRQPKNGTLELLAIPTSAGDNSRVRRVLPPLERMWKFTKCAHPRRWSCHAAVTISHTFSRIPSFLRARGSCFLGKLWAAPPACLSKKLSFRCFEISQRTWNRVMVSFITVPFSFP